MNTQNITAKNSQKMYFEHTMEVREIIDVCEQRGLTYEIAKKHIIVNKPNNFHAVWEIHGKGLSQLAFYRHTYNYATKIKDVRVWALNLV